MLPSPELTVGIPAYNAVRTIAKAVRSVQAQTWDGSMEILVYNDGSTDGTAALVASLAEKDPRIRLVSCSENKGRPHARNQLLEQARGTFFAWLDADDEWFPDKLSRQFFRLREAYAELGHENVWCLCSFSIQSDATRKIRIYSPDLDGDLMKNILYNTIHPLLQTMLGSLASMRNVGIFDLQCPRLQDFDFFIRFVSSGGVFVATDKKQCLVSYNRTESDVEVIKYYQAHEYLRNKYSGLYKSYGSEYVKEEKSRRMLFTARIYLQKREYVSAIVWGIKSIMIRPIWSSAQIVKFIFDK